MKGKTSLGENLFFRSDPWVVTKGPTERTLGMFLPQLSALERAPKINEQARDAREAYELALNLFEKDRDACRRTGRAQNPAIAKAMGKAYELYDRLSARASWAKAPGETGGSTFAPRRRWKNDRSHTFSGHFPRPPGAV